MERALESRDRRILGFLVVGFGSLVGGIFIFAFIILPSRQPETGVPRDVQMVFTEVFSQQNLLKNERGRYSAALVELGLEPNRCQMFNCLLTSSPTGDDYQFRLTKGVQTWVIQSKSPVPIEVLP